MQNWDMGKNQICQLKHLAGGSCFPLAHSWSNNLLGFFKGLLILRLFHLQLGSLGEDKSSPLLGAHTGCASAALLHLTVPQELGLAAIKLATGKKWGRGEFFCCVILLTQLIWIITLLRQTSFLHRSRNQWPERWLETNTHSKPGDPHIKHCIFLSPNHL